MSGQNTKKKRLGSRRMIQSQKEASDAEFHAAVGTSVAQPHVPEESFEALNAPSNPYDSKSEAQCPVSPDVLMNRRKLGSSRRNKGRHHVKDSETEPHREPGGEVEEKSSSNKNLEATEMSVATQLEKLEEICRGSEQDISLSHKSFLDSASTPDFYSEVEKSSPTNSPEEVMEILIPTDENKLEGIEKSDIMQSQEMKLNPHDVGISESATIRVLSCPSADEKLIDLQPSNTKEMPDEELFNVYPVHELPSKTRDGNVTDSEYLQSPSMASESVDLDILTSDITTNKSSPREILELQKSEDQTVFLSPKEKLPANEQQDELFTVSEIGQAQHSVDVVNTEYDRDVNKTQLRNVRTNLNVTQSLVLKATENVCPVQADIQNIPKVRHLDNSPSADELTETGYEQSRNRRKLGSSRRNKGRQKMKEFKEDFLENTKDDDTSKTITLTPGTEREDSSEGAEDDIMPVSHGSSLFLMSTLGSSSEILEPFLTTYRETDLQSLSAKSETLEEDQDEREASFKVEASEKSMKATLDEVDKFDTIDNGVVRGAQHSEDAVMTPSEEEIKPTHTPETMPRHYTSESAKNDATIENLEPLNQIDQAENWTPNQSKVMLESTDDVTTKKEDSTRNEKQHEHCCKPDQRYEGGGQVENDAKVNAEQTVNQNKDSVASEPEESDFSFQFLPTEQEDLFYSQPQDKSSSAEEQTEAGYDHSRNRRKLGSSRRNKGRQKIEEMSGNTKNDDTPKTISMTLTPGTEDETLSQENNEGIVLSVSQDPTMFLISTSGNSSEIPEPSITNYPETDLQGLSAKSEALEEDEDERETGFKVEVSEKSMEATLDEVDKSDPFEREEVRGAQHSEDAIRKLPEEEMKSTPLQEIMPRYCTSERAQNYSTIGSLLPWDLIDQAETRTSFQSKVMVESTVVTTKKRDSDPNVKQDEHHRKLSQKHEGGGQVENDAKVNAEQAVNQNKDSVASEPEESHFSFQILPTEQDSFFDSQPQDKSSSAEEQTETDYDHSRNRRKLGSSRRNKGREKIKEFKEDISGNTNNDNILKTISMALTPGTEDEKLSHENNEGNILSVSQDSTMFLISTPGNSSQIPEPSITNYPETDLQSLSAKRETLEDQDERKTGFKVEASEKSLEATLDEVDKSDPFEREEVRGAQHSEDAVMTKPEEIKSTRIQEIMPTCYTSESSQNDAIVEILEPWDLIDQARTSFQSKVMVKSTDDVTTTKEDSDPNVKQDESHCKPDHKYEGGGQVENYAKLNAEQIVYYSEDRAISEPEESHFSFQILPTEQNDLFESQPLKIETLEEDQDESEMSFKVKLTGEAPLGKLYQSDTLKSEEIGAVAHSDDQTIKKDVQSTGIQQMLQDYYASEMVTKDASHKDSDSGDKRTETHVEILDQNIDNHNLCHTDEPIDEGERVDTTPDRKDKSKAEDKDLKSSTEEAFHQEKEEVLTEIDVNKSSLQNLDSETCFNAQPQNYSVDIEEKIEIGSHLSGVRRKLASSRRKKRGQFNDDGLTDDTNPRTTTEIPYKEVETKETLVETSVKEMDKSDSQTCEVNIQSGNLVCRNETDLSPKDGLPTKEETFFDVNGSQSLEDAEKSQISCAARIHTSQDDLIPSGEKTPHQESKELFKYSSQSFQCQIPTALDSQSQRNHTASSHGGSREKVGVCQENSLETMGAKDISGISHTEDMSDKAKQNPHFGTGIGISEVTRPMAELFQSSSSKMSDKELQTVYSVSENREKDEDTELKLNAILQGNNLLTHVDPESTESFETKEISKDENRKDKVEYSLEKETFSSPDEMDKNGEQNKPFNLSKVLGVHQAGDVENKVHEEPLDAVQIQDMLQICYTSDLGATPPFQKSETSAPLDFQLQEESLSFKDVIHTGYAATGNRRKLGSSRRNKGRQQVKDPVTDTHPQPKDDSLESTSADEAPLTTKTILTTEINLDDLKPAEAVTKLQSPESESTENLRGENNCVSQNVFKNSAVGITDVRSSTDEFFKSYEDSVEKDKNYVKEPDNLSVHTGSGMLQMNLSQSPQGLFWGNESDIQNISSHDDNESSKSSNGDVPVQKEATEVHIKEAFSCDKDDEKRTNLGTEIVDLITTTESSMDVTSSALGKVEEKCKNPTDEVLVSQNILPELVGASNVPVGTVSDESGLFPAVDSSNETLKEEMDLGHIENLQVKSQKKRRKLGSTRRSQLNRKQEDEEVKDETTESDFNTESDVRNLESMKDVEELPLCVEVSQLKNMTQLSSTACKDLQVPYETSSAHDHRSELQSSSPDLQSSDSNVIPGMNDLMSLLPEQPGNLEVVNSVTSIKVDDVGDEERTKDVSMQPSQTHNFPSTEVQMTSGENAYLMKLQNNENTENFAIGSFVSSCETTQSAHSEEKPESVKVTQDQFTNEKISNTVDNEAQSRSVQMKSSSPSSNSANRRRKMGSTRKSLTSRAKRELHQKQEEDNEETEPQTPVGDVTTGTVPEIKEEELQPHTEDNNGDSEQSKEKVLEKVECTQVFESHLKPPAQQTVSQSQPVLTEHQLDADNLPSIAPESDAMSELVPAGRRRKMGSHRKSHGYKNREDQRARIIGAENGSSVTEEDEIKETEEQRDESMDPGKISKVEVTEKKPASSISVSKVREDSRPVSENTPVQPLHADVRLGYESQKQFTLAGNPRGAELRSNGYNLVMIGDSSVGKTSFMKRAQSGKFSLDLPASVGLDSCMWTVVVDGEPVVLRVWDTAGQERFRSITRQIFHRAQAFLLMYDICSSQSFSSVSYWANCIQESAAENVVVLLLGNKSDCVARQVETHQGESLAQGYNFGFMECSAATGDNVIQSLQTVARMLSQRFDSRRNATVLHKEPEQKKQSRCC